MNGVLNLRTPWARQALTSEERRAIQARIPEGYTVSVMPKSNGSAWGVEVIEWGETMFRNRVIRERRYHRSIRDGIDAAIDWIADHDTATFAGVAVPVR